MPKEGKPRAAKSEGPAKAGKKAKAKKDKDAPKKPLSAYMFFSKANREQAKSDNPEASFGELGKILGKQWSDMSEEDKKPYQDQNEQDKKRYEKEQAEYLAKKPADAEKAEEKAEDDEDDE